MFSWKCLRKKKQKVKVGLSNFGSWCWDDTLELHPRIIPQFDLIFIFSFDWCGWRQKVRFFEAGHLEICRKERPQVTMLHVPSSPGLYHETRRALGRASLAVVVGGRLSSTVPRLLINERRAIVFFTYMGISFKQGACQQRAAWCEVAWSSSLGDRSDPWLRGRGVQTCFWTMYLSCNPEYKEGNPKTTESDYAQILLHFSYSDFTCIRMRMIHKQSNRFVHDKVWCSWYMWFWIKAKYSNHAWLLLHLV